MDQVVPDLSEYETFISVEVINHVDLHDNEPRNYVAGYISKKLCLLQNNQENLNLWIYVKGEEKFTQPSTELIEIVAKCYILFDAYRTMAMGSESERTLWQNSIPSLLKNIPPSLLKLLSYSVK